MLPLVWATGPGAVSRVSLGLAVLGGMLMATIVGTILVPGLFVVIQGLREMVKGPPECRRRRPPRVAVEDKERKGLSGLSLFFGVWFW